MYMGSPSIRKPGSQRISGLAAVSCKELTVACRFGSNVKHVSAASGQVTLRGETGERAKVSIEMRLIKVAAACSQVHQLRRRIALQLPQDVLETHHTGHFLRTQTHLPLEDVIQTLGRDTEALSHRGKRIGKRIPGQQGQ